MPPRKVGMKIIVEHITQGIEKLDGVKTKTRGKKTSFTRNKPFASLSISRDSVKLEFITPSKINHTRMKKVKKVAGSKFSHTIVIKTKEDIDPQVNGWLMIAHATN